MRRHCQSCRPRWGGITKRAVVKHLEALEKKGRILRSSKPRGIKLIEVQNENLMTMNILGYANAGAPLVYAEEQKIGVLRIDKSLLPVTKNVFALVVKGDSMNRRKLNGTALTNGNYAIVANDQPVSNGDVVLAIIDGCATIKSYRRDGGIIVLYPESTNSAHRPIYLSSDSDGTIYGKVISVLANPV
ncbi:MAG: LexA repressor [candidate division WS6 bacterium OLB20]|uniref:LexA repressor n=1 Tax=candidate division WS6 bacterium OLB20 TaxID=1617426 RepID=A0A136M0A0_9BACT|nr:MAG: LexA repressor [candidate division WS6 bacterium OLB20]